jgi:hypothetical protein
MEVMKGLLSVFRKALPAKPAATAARDEFDRRLADFRKASGVMESCIIGFMCGRTRRPFEFRFERGSRAELFTLVSVRKPEGGAATAARAAPRAGRALNLAEFDSSGWACPFCRAQTFVRCRCGINCCDPRAHQTEHGLFTCAACGLETPTVPLTMIETRRDGGIRSQSKAAQLPRPQAAGVLLRK